MTLCIARQPIFDSSERLYAYDLAALTLVGDGYHVEPTPEELLSELFLEVGLDRVAGDASVVLTLGSDLLRARTLPAIPTERVIVEVPANCVTMPEIRDACDDFRRSGYRVAMQTGQPRTREELELVGQLAAHCDIAKVDIAGMARGQLPHVADVARHAGARLLASNVRHSGERNACRSLGFELFEGHRFASPETYPSKTIGIEHLRAFQLLQLVRDMTTPDDKVELYLRRDIGLVYRLLRMVNSAGVGGREITSIGHALRVLGRETLAAWLSVLLVSTTVDTPVRAEIARTSLMRARMCERLADVMDAPARRGSFFLVGMLSVFDDLLETRVESLCASLNLAVELRGALIYRNGLAGEVLRLVECYSSGSWLAASETARALNVEARVLPPLYLEALGWSTKVELVPTTGTVS